MEKQRIIKFRSWDKEYKKMWIPSLIDTMCLDWMTGHFAVYSSPSWRDDKDGFDCHYGEGGTQELMQFTGLKDVDSVEIYEHDIVEYKTGNESNPTIQEKVYYNGGAFYPVCTQPGETFKVIGNVYENPDLCME